MTKSNTVSLSVKFLAAFGGLCKTVEGATNILNQMGLQSLDETVRKLWNCCYGEPQQRSLVYGMVTLVPEYEEKLEKMLERYIDESQFAPGEADVPYLDVQDHLEYEIEDAWNSSMPGERNAIYLIALGVIGNVLGDKPGTGEFTDMLIDFYKTLKREEFLQPEALWPKPKDITVDILNSYSTVKDLDGEGKLLGMWDNINGVMKTYSM